MKVELTELSIPTAKGYSLSACSFHSQKDIEQTLVISSATGVLQKYYSKFATHFAEQGFKVYTFDYSGIGKSGSEISKLKRNTTNLSEWGSNDQSALIAYAKNENPEASLTLITHSIGGQLVGFNTNYKLIDKIIIVGSQTGYWKYFKGIHLPKMWLFWYALIPLFTPLFGYFPAKKLGFFENLPKQMVYEWATWGRKKEYLMHFHDQSSYFFDQIDIPMLAWSFQFDTYAPKETVDWLVKQFKSAKIKRIHYIPEKGTKKVGHFGFFKKAFKDPLWDKTLQWILNEDVS